MQKTISQIKIFAAIFPMLILLISCNKQVETKSLPTIENERNDSSEVNISNTQSDTFNWQYTLCDYIGSYNSEKFNKKQLENTLKYLVNSDGTSISVIVFTVRDLNDYKHENVKLEFDDRLRKLKTLEFVKTPFFEKIKEKRIQEVERTKLLTLMKLDAYTNAEVLRNDKYSKEQCAEYTNALIAGGQTLLELRKKMAEEASKAGNEIAMEKYLEETKTNNELLLARIYVSSMGWWNCVNNSIDRVDEHEAHQNGFLKLFESVSFECEEP